MNDSSKIIGEGLTYDDVLLVPAYSEVLPRSVDVRSRFSRGIQLNLPFVSAAMDTVTEAEMAIAMARDGGIGVIHKNMTITAQAVEVKKVKRAESGMIIDPVTLNINSLVADAKQMMRENKIGGIPVVDENGILVGIVTNRDLRFERNDGRKVDDVMTKMPLITTTENTSLSQAEDILQQHKIEKLPVVDPNGKLVGLITYKDIIKQKSQPNSCKDGLGRLRVAAAVGITPDMMDRVEALVSQNVDAIVIDTAHGHSKGVVDALKSVKQAFPNLQVVVGNIATGSAAKMLVDAGADAIKVGIGPGSICTTRVVAGVGVPQLSAIMMVHEAIGDSGVPIIADGGVRYSGDIVKALAAGADTVMFGSLLAGTEESPGETVIYEGRRFKTYRGMGSVEAMQAGSKDRYFQDVEDDIKKLVPEGIVGRVPFKGPLGEVIFQFTGGLRAGMGYCGAENIAKLKKSKFVKITAAGVHESHPHNVAITREAPNYSPR